MKGEVIKFRREKKGQIRYFQKNISSEKKVAIAARMLYDSFSNAELQEVIKLYNEIVDYEAAKKDQERRNTATGFEIKYNDI